MLTTPKPLRKPKEISHAKITLFLTTEQNNDGKTEQNGNNSTEQMGTEQTKTLQEWCHYFNVSYVNARMRYTRGKRGLDIFNIQSDKTLEPKLRARLDKTLGLPRTVRQYFEIPAKYKEKFEHHMRRLKLTPEEMVEGMFEITMNRLDKHELKYYNPVETTETEQSEQEPQHNEQEPQHSTQEPSLDTGLE